MLQVLARSATGERMNPYTSIWTGVTPGDGPQRFHVVLLDNGRSPILAKQTERQTLRCIRCAACMNTCPVYRQTGGHAYGSVYPGPIGAILTPQLMQMHHAQTLPFASSLCGACYEVCPVKINIPEVLLELRSQVVNQERGQAGRFFDPMYLGLRVANLIFSRAWLFHTAQFFGRIGHGLFTRKDGWIHSLPSVGGKWTQTRDLRGLPDQTFHEWWASARSATGGQMSASRNPGSRFLTAFARQRSSARCAGSLGCLCGAPPRLRSRRRHDAGGLAGADDRAPARIRCRGVSAPAGLAAAIAAQLAASGRRKFVAPPGLPADVAGAAGFDWKIDRDLYYGRDRAGRRGGHGGLLRRRRSGTIVLHHSQPKAGESLRCCPTGTCASSCQPGGGDAARVL